MPGTSRRTAAALAALALAGTLAAGCAAGASTAGMPLRSAAAPSPSGSDCWRPGTSGDDWDSWGPGMGPRMMGRDDCSWGPGMMGGHYWQRGDGAPVKTLDQARQRADAFADRLDLRVGEVMQFSKNFYAELETPGGKLATEILVDPADGDTGIEYGPAMMWNTDYGMHHRGQTQTRISPDQAQDRAQQWLRDRGSDLTAGEAESFPGYYTLHTLRSGKINGMLSVNASTGAVWDHTWHGTYIATSEH
ncbi:hypothetical protein [Streptomyces sp. NBC_01481]|uniref:hypothetical protein n=1 Tax=Streptomyces sp. NBC_01481 TaxID=2975869 RepID=UPI00225A8D68|nr:hypothetical protein [Streptomyces sp. NBC_01481]MCX4585736.1 hypothetical protein [Streptomyces sp. NBC_01481]